MNTKRMSINEELEYARKFFAHVRDSRFQAALANKYYGYQEIVPVMPKEAWDMLISTEMGTMFIWAGAMLRYGQFPLSAQELDRLVKISAQGAKLSSILLEFGCNYELLSSHIRQLVDSVCGEPEFAHRVLCCVNRYKLTCEQIDQLTDTVATSSYHSYLMLSNIIGILLSQEQANRLFESVVQDSERSYSLLQVGCQYPLSQEQLDRLLESVLQDIYACYNLLSDGSKYELSPAQIKKLYERVLESSVSVL